MLSKEPSSNEIKEEFYIMTILDLIDGATYQQLNEELKRYEEDEMYWQCAGIKKALDQSNYLTLKDLKEIANEYYRNAAQLGGQ